MRKFLLIGVFIAVLSSACICVGAAYAQNQTDDSKSDGAGTGLKISPTRLDLTIKPGETKTVKIQIQNMTGAPVNVRGLVNDFIPGSDESGQPKIVLDDSEDTPTNSFVTLVSDVTKLELGPGEKGEATVTINAIKTTPSGGYYGAVRFATGNAEGRSVALNASVGTIFLIRVPGNLTEKLNVVSFDVTKNGNTGTLFDSGPLSVQTRFRNQGNIHVQPFGKIYIKNFTGNVVQTIEINETQPRGSVLPDSIRRFDNPIDVNPLFGKFTAEAAFGYGSNSELLTANKTFYVIPIKLISIILVVVGLITLILPKIIRAHRPPRARPGDE
jgi:hypothetical protein